MNYITTNHRGGLGNAMFKIAAAVSLAKDNNVEYLFSKDFIRPGIDPDYNTYSNNVLRNLHFLDKLSGHFSTWVEPSFNYTPIVYEKNTNLLLDGYYQSAKYFQNNSDYIVDLFKPTEDITEAIIVQVPDISSYVSIHVRRGDYLTHPNHHPQQPVEYFKQATQIIGMDKTYLIFSDDILGCEELFTFLPNKYYVQSQADWMDLYMMTLCESNIICNSTFSWWGAYLNSNPFKKVIAPLQWLGPAYADLDTSDVCPTDWIKL
jgi:hypothetical protein